MSDHKQQSDPPSSDAKEKPRCGLCGKTKKLTRTPCCGNWICDDADKYVPFSYARNSCFRNHSMFTICGFHHNQGHERRWQDCAKCRENGPLEIYVHHATNEYNFEKLENPPSFEPTHCAECGVAIRLSAGGYLMKGDQFFCDTCSAARHGMPAQELHGKFYPSALAQPAAATQRGNAGGNIGTIACYGPDNKLATKLVAAVFRRSGDEEPLALHRWITHAGDVRDDKQIAREVKTLFAKHKVEEVSTSEGIIGCPHEEEKDYPVGGTCPHCLFWSNQDRFTHELKATSAQRQQSEERLAPPPLFENRLSAQPYQPPPKVGRNEPCPCGSRKKYKKCCGTS